jgi:hypothetical protein
MNQKETRYDERTKMLDFAVQRLPPGIEIVTLSLTFKRSLPDHEN